MVDGGWRMADSEDRDLSGSLVGWAGQAVKQWMGAALDPSQILVRGWGGCRIRMGTSGAGLFG